MVLSRREKVIVLVTVVVVGALVADKFVLTPAMDRLEQTANEKQQLLADLNEARNVFERRRLMERKWRSMLADGLLGDAAAESRVLHALGQWSRQVGLTLNSVKPERVAAEEGLPEIVFDLAGLGSMHAVTRFLWQVETAELPLRIRDLQLGVSGDLMSLQLTLSAIYEEAEEEKSDTEKEDA